jgi:sialate O-acetylesterase
VTTLKSGTSEEPVIGENYLLLINYLLFSNMKKLFLTSVLLVIFLSGNLLLKAEVRLPAILGSHMVLQQKSEVDLWGWCAPSEKINIKASWDTARYVTTGTSGARWSTKIRTPEAGGPYTITINKVVLEDVMAGEVWVCGGQSNMEWSGDQKLKQSLEEAPNARNEKIRFFYVPKNTSEYPQDDVKASWKVCTPEEMIHFSALGYFFGKKLQGDLNMPVGLINSNWGGTPAEVWTPKEMIENDPVLKDASLKLKPSAGWPIVPGSSYAAMISPLTKFRIAGVIWYQGESNTQNYTTYSRLMTRLIGGWRDAWGYTFPFYYVQIAPFSGYGNYNVGALLREQQTACLSISRTGMAVIHDLVDDVTNIHPGKKAEVAERLARLALADSYGVGGIVYKYPMYRGVVIEKNRIRILFDNVSNGLMATAKDLNEFYIAGADKKFLFASAKIEGNTVVVWNKAIKEPVAVRFGFSNNGIPNLFNKEGMPVNLFRTDNWEVRTDAIVK